MYQNEFTIDYQPSSGFDIRSFKESLGENSIIEETESRNFYNIIFSTEDSFLDIVKKIAKDFPMTEIQFEYYNSIDCIAGKYYIFYRDILEDSIFEKGSDTYANIRASFELKDIMRQISKTEWDPTFSESYI